MTGRTIADLSDAEMDALDALHLRRQQADPETHTGECWCCCWACEETEGLDADLRLIEGTR